MKTFSTRLSAALMLLAVLATAGSAQTVRTRSPLWVGAPLDDYIRLLQLTGEVPLSSRMLRPLNDEARALRLSDTASLSRNPWRARYGSRQNGDTGRFGIEIYDPIIRSTYNSRVPYSTNDGAMWAGRGISGAMDIGGAIRYGPLTLRLAPTIWYARNTDFTLGKLQSQYINGVERKNSVPADMSPYADPYMSWWIDMPQRFGNKPVHEVNLGQSSLQVSSYGLRAGFGTENMWWGPGRENAVLMTNNASGFPHGFAGTARPVGIWIGKLEALYTIGFMRQSDYWRSAASDTVSKRWMSALIFILEPRGAPGLYLGAAREFYGYIPTAGLSTSDVFEIFQPFTKSSFQTNGSTGDDSADQMISFFGRWVFPETNFEVYGELARNDHPVDRRDLVLEPDHALGYVMGLQKLFPRPGGWVRLSVEMVNLVGGLTQVVRAQPTWYGHPIVPQGYTQHGQVIGAGVGPGGEAKRLQIDRLGKWGSVGGFYEWQRVNTDQYFRQHIGQFQRHYHDVFLTAGARFTVRAGPVDISTDIARQDEYNRYWTRFNDLTNYHVTLSAQFSPPGR